MTGSSRKPARRPPRGGAGSSSGNAMRIEQAREVAAALRRERLELPYTAHRHAAWLLSRRVGQGAHTRELKASRHGRLLANPLVRQAAARAGSGVLTRESLDRTPTKHREVYRIGTSTWGPRRPRDWDCYYQTSRPGSNLVVLLDFSRRHNAIYRRWLDPEGKLVFVNECHPHAHAPEITLAWARIDLDLEHGEALVEEVQSDWIREFQWLWSITSRMSTTFARDEVVREYLESASACYAALDRYWTRVLQHHRAWWAEATLFAALWVLVERLRFRRIYYHTAEGGAARKQIGYRKPPRSLYSKLPERFGFELTREPPRLLRGRGGEAEELPWYRLEL